MTEQNTDLCNVTSQADSGWVTAMTQFYRRGREGAEEGAKITQ